MRSHDRNSLKSPEMIEMATICRHSNSDISGRGHVTYRTKSMASATTNTGAGGKGFDPCWICGERTHKRKDCPSKGKITVRNHGSQKQVVRAAAQQQHAWVCRSPWRACPQICFGCRQPGHSLRQCRAARTTATSCFNCGSSGHNLSACPAPRTGSALKFATCFVCKQPGHISRDCPKNEAGVYVRGGRCMKCGSARHYASECGVGAGGADGEAEEGAGDGDDDEAAAVAVADSGAAADALEPEALSPPKKDKKKKKKEKKPAAAAAPVGDDELDEGARG